MSQSASAAIDELMTCDTVQRAHREIMDAYNGVWSLPRISQSLDEERASEAHASRKRQLPVPVAEISSEAYFIPPGSRYLLGSIENRRNSFLETAPKFDLAILDPPWPSRSVRRKKDRYSTAYNMQEIHDLLSLLPIAGHLKPDGLVAVWVTNKPAVIDMLKSPGGMFDQWGLETIGEWIWVKITSKGEPVVDFESTWRKPWERLVIARRKGSLTKIHPQRKVIFAVPDLHSRKPNLKTLFDEILPTGYLGLEVFSRHLTAGWWSWGDQTLLFQHKDHWVNQSVPQ
ncbi:putative MT-A70-domain-containing protein [Seiridium cardinale]